MTHLHKFQKALHMSANVMFLWFLVRLTKKKPTFFCMSCNGFTTTISTL